MADAKKKKKFCVTVIPKSWPQLTGPAYRDGMSVAEAQRLWAGFLRVQRQVRRNPIVYAKEQ
jgi:hypothetical protein